MEHRSHGAGGHLVHLTRHPPHHRVRVGGGGRGHGAGGRLGGLYRVGHVQGELVTGGVSG